MQQSESSGPWENVGNSRTWENPRARLQPWQEFRDRVLTRRDFRICSLSGLPVVITPTELDIDTCRQLSPAILAASTDATVVVVDMTATTFFDCFSLGVLMRTYQHLKDNGVELRVASSHERVRWLLAEFGDDRRVRVFDTLAEAVTAMPMTARPRNWSPYRQAA